MKTTISKTIGLQVGFTTEWVVLDNSEWRVLTTNEKALVDVEYNAKLLANAKEAKRNAIRSEFEATSNAPVEVNQVSYHGGFDSAIKLDAVKRLSETLGAMDVAMYDTMNVGHLLSLVDAQNVITQIAGKYQMDFATKQARMVAVEECLTIEEVEVV